MNTLLSYYCSNVYLCSLWFKFRKSAMNQLVIAYIANAFIILFVHRLPMRCDARVDSCEARKVAEPGNRLHVVCCVF